MGSCSIGFLSLQAQLVVLSAQIAWSENVEAALTSISGGEDLTPMLAVQSNVEATLNVLADTVLMEQPPLRRRKLEHLVGRTQSEMFFRMYVGYRKILKFLFYSVPDHRAGAPT